MIFTDFLSVFSIHGMSKATPETTKMNAFWRIFASQATACGFNHCDTGRRIFCDHFVMNFVQFLTIFASVVWTKSNTGNDKMNAFSCVFAGQATVWVFDHCNTGCDTFSCSFCGDFKCILTSFCKILDARLEPWSRCMNGHWSTSKCVFFIIFWSVFDPAKIELQPLVCGFPEK